MKTILGTICLVLAMLSSSWTAMAMPMPQEESNPDLCMGQIVKIAVTVDSFDEFVRNADSTSFKSIDGVLFYKNKLIAYPGLKTDESYNIPPEAVSIAAGAFAYSKEPYLRSLSFPAECMHIPSDLSFYKGLSNVEEYSVEAGNPVYASMDGYVVEKATNTLIAYPAGRKIKDLSIPDSIRIIGEGAIAYNKSLEHIRLPETLVSIGDFAFYWCDALKTIDFGSSLEEIGVSAFEACNQIKEVIFPASLKTIDPLAFGQADSLQTVFISNGCETICDAAFLGCPLREVHLPPSITYFGEQVFGDIDDYEFDGPIKIYVTKGSFAEKFVREFIPGANVITGTP